MNSHTKAELEKYFSLLPPGAYLSPLGRYPNNGQFSGRATPEDIPLEQFISDMENIFATDKVEKEDLITLSISVESMLKHYIEHLITLINNASNTVFNQFVGYDEKGIFRTFAMRYNIILAGKETGNHSLREGIARLYEHYSEKFLKPIRFNRDQHLERMEGTRDSFIEDKVKNFSMLLNVLCMSIMCEYYAERDLFSLKTLIAKDIQQIRDYLDNLMNGPALCYQKAIELHKLYLLINAPKELERFEIITGQKIDKAWFAQLIQANMQSYSSDCYLNTDEDRKTYEYFSGVTFMYNQLNHVEVMYYKLLELSKSDNPESQEAARILFRIDLPLKESNQELPEL